MLEMKRRTEEISGVPNLTYDLISVLDSKLEGIAAFEEYKADAREAGDRDVERLFDEMQRRDAEEVGRLRKMLAERLR